MVVTAIQALTDQIPVTIGIPRLYHRHPVVAYLAKDWGLDVNIYAAQLSGQGQEDGWFELGLPRAARQISDALRYLDHQSVEVWRQTLGLEDWWGNNNPLTVLNVCLS
ncbi:MAG: ABC transporter [Synechococcaceae cyanobacterium RM1_1_27]|nr:ABC transporter [Synechococcaceae cyanobacterium SM2_3_2]NJO85943.1 ABC transporter [Synechococcaceae cyanobacterium RM1_1_27]